MKKKKCYEYIGRNGTIISQVFLDNALKIDMYHLIAEKGKVLTDGEKFLHSVYIYADDLDQWHEIDEQGQD